jgi:hypothetical protein
VEDVEGRTEASMEAVMAELHSSHARLDSLDMER